MTATSPYRAVIAAAYGGPEVLEVVELPASDPGEGQVLVEVRAAGVNPADWKLYTGAFGTDLARLPRRLGFEASGVVLAVGPGVDGVAPGDEVIVQPAQGAYAEQVVAPVGAVLPKPSALSWEQAAGLLLAGTTAWHTVVAAQVGPGDTVLVHGAAGGVGGFVTQLAALRGARVIGTASAARHDDVSAAGAEPVVYGPGLADRVRALLGDGEVVTAAIDTVGTDEALDTSVELVADRARIVSIAGFARGGELGIRLLGSGPGADPGTEVRRSARAELIALAAAGRLTITVAATYPLASVADAHRAGMAGHTHGKIVLIP